MVSYYNHPFHTMYQKNGGGSNIPYTTSPSAAAWYQNYHHQTPNAFLGEPDGPPQSVYYPHHVFQQSSPDWAGHENYAVPPQSGPLLQGPGQGSGNNGHGGPAGFLSINQATQNGNEHLNDGLHSMPSPPITVSGSDMSSPGAPNGSTSPHMNSRPTPVKSPYEWMKKPSYQSQPNPGKKSIFYSCLCCVDAKNIHEEFSFNVRDLRSTQTPTHSPIQTRIFSCSVFFVSISDKRNKCSIFHFTIVFDRLIYDS